MAEDISGAGHGQAPIIRKVIKKSEGHHGGAWKVAYADMVTALMALFIVLWIMSQSDEITRSVAGYFRDPVGWREGGVPTPIEGGTNAGDPSVFEQVVPPPSTSSSGGDDARKRWREQAGDIRGALERVPAFAKYGDQIEMAITSEGLRISLIESSDTPLFKVGETELEPDALDVFHVIGAEIAALQKHIVIEGHTDSRPFPPSANRTNWELATGRSNTARRVLLGAGVDESQIFEVRGFADRILYNPLDPQDSRNRRVSITLLSDEAYEARTATESVTVID